MVLGVGQKHGSIPHTALKELFTNLPAFSNTSSSMAPTLSFLYKNALLECVAMEKEMPGLLSTPAA